MPANSPPNLALSDGAARQLANATKTTAQMSTISPRWLVRFMDWVPVEAGIYRLNKVKHPEEVEVACPPRSEIDLPTTFVDYEENPREYFLSSVTTVLDVHTRVSDLYSSPYDQIEEQLRLTIETIKERQESELINNADYGLLANAAPEQRLSTREGPPTPDDLDELITKVWKEPAFFLTHPRGHRRLRARVHPARRAAADGEPVRLPVPHLARHPADPAQTRCRSSTARPRCSCCASARPGRASSASTSRALPGEQQPGPVGALHGHQAATPSRRT